MNVFRIFGVCLVVVHAFLGVWALGGMMEWLNMDVPWKPYSNPEFPHWLLFFHWGTVLFAATVYLIGYFTHWRQTPHWMAVAYGMMALVCVVETFWYMTSSFRYIAMVLEYAAYVVILLVLYSQRFRGLHFLKKFT